MEWSGAALSERENPFKEPAVEEMPGKKKKQNKTNNQLDVSWLLKTFHLYRFGSTLCTIFGYWWNVECNSFRKRPPPPNLEECFFQVPFSAPLNNHERGLDTQPAALIYSSSERWKITNGSKEIGGQLLFCRFASRLIDVRVQSGERQVGRQFILYNAIRTCVIRLPIPFPWQRRPIRP